MDYEKEEKKQFVKMLGKKQIIIIECNKSNSRKTYDYKFIGADDNGRWDFTALMKKLSRYPSNKGCQRLCVCALDGISVIADACAELHKEGLFESTDTDFGLYSYIREQVTTFYM